MAAPFVTGTTALLWSAFPAATAAHIKLAITQASTLRRASVVPPLLDAAAAYQVLLDSECEEVNDMPNTGHGTTPRTRVNVRLAECAYLDLSRRRRSALAKSSSGRHPTSGYCPAEAAHAGRRHSTAGWCSPDDSRNSGTT